MILLNNTIEKTDNYCRDYIFSKVRIVRNFKDYSFLENLSYDKKNKLENEVIDFVKSMRETATVYDTTSLTQNEKQYFIENCLLSEEFLNKKNAKFIYFEKNKILLTLNSKEHIKISIANPLLSLYEQYKEVNKLEKRIGNRFEYCVSPKYGFLTQEIKNSGLGIKLSVLVHLPGFFLDNDKNDVFGDLDKKGYVVEKWNVSNENSIFYIISSKLNFGVSEEKLIDRFMQGIKSLINMDKEILINYYNNNKSNLDDIIFRSYGILKYAKQMEQGEALNHISNLMIGERLGFDIPLKQNTLNILVREVLDGNIVITAEKDRVENQTARMNLIKRYISLGENYV